MNLNCITYKTLSKTLCCYGYRMHSVYYNWECVEATPYVYKTTLIPGQYHNDHEYDKKESSIHVVILTILQIGTVNFILFGGGWIHYVYGVTMYSTLSLYQKKCFTNDHYNNKIIIITGY